MQIADEDLADELDRSLRDDLMRHWFPRVVDPGGGYVENFDHAWRPAGDDRRSLVHQARLAWTAAAFAAHDPARRDEFAAHALHGMRFIHTVLRDETNGGFYFDVGIDGRPRRNGDKHACALAYAVFAGARVFASSGERIALDVARDAASWLEQYSRRPDGTFIEDLRSDGTPLMQPPISAKRRLLDLIPLRSRKNPLGRDYGSNTMNTQIHVLEAFAELHRSAPDARCRAGLESILSVVRDRFLDGNGNLADRLDADGHPTGLATHGHAVETAFLLLDASSALGTPDDESTTSAASKLAQNVLHNARDYRHGGTFDAPHRDGGDKLWWVMAEALNTWATMYGEALRRPGDMADAGLWRNALVDEWRFIGEFLVDRENGGWFHSTASDGVPRRKFPRSDGWTDPYHNGRALMRAAAILRETGR